TPLLGHARAADRNRVDLDGGAPNAHGHALAVLAAGPDAVAQLDVATEHGHPAKDVGPVAYEVYPLEGCGDLAVLHEVALGKREHEIAIRDVHLSASELLGVDAAPHTSQDLLRIVGSGEQDRV